MENVILSRGCGGWKGKNAVIKGVNRRIVEITSTEHEFFEKAVLYVKSDKAALPAEKITEEAREYLRRIIPVKRRTAFPLAVKLAAVGAVLAVIAAAVCLIVLM